MSQRLQRLQQMLAASPGDSFLLFAIAKEFATKKITEAEVDQKLKETFEKYLVDEKTASAKN